MPNEEPAKIVEPAKPSELSQFQSGVDERCLWIDPLAQDERIKSGSVLLDDVIKDYVLKFNLLFDQKTFAEGKLKGGSYTMTPAADDAWRFVPSEKPDQPDIKLKLEKGRDNRGDFFWVPRNSLVYIRLGQTLRLPFYIIGRHNLKIRYAYKGLLLGTGPQVDPGFEGNLFIPLHNFTTSDVKVHISESFVSIDFVRTTNFIESTEPSVRTSDELRRVLGGTRKLIELPKVTSRNSLEDYLDGATPRSQMAHFQAEVERLVKKMDEDLSKAKLEIETARRWGNWERLAATVAFIGLMLTGLNYFRGFVADVKNESKEIKEIAGSTKLLHLNETVSGLAGETYRLNEKFSSYPPLTNRLNDVEDRLDILERRLKMLQTNHSPLIATNSFNVDKKGVSAGQPSDKQ